MKILHVTNNYPTSEFPIFGIFVKEQINSLQEIGVENMVFFINGRVKGKCEYLKSVLRLRKFLKNNDFDIIHCHHALSALCLILSGRCVKNQTIVSFQNDPRHEFGIIIYNIIKNKIAYRIFKNKSDLIIDDTAFYLPNGVNLDFFKPMDFKESCNLLNLDPSKKYILFVSSNFLRRQKRYDRFREVMKILKKQYKHDNIEELLLINTKREFVPYYFGAADLHLLTSDFEGSPNSVKESLACNTPVVSTNVGNVKELLNGTDYCFVSEKFEAEELAVLCDKAMKKNSNLRNIIIEKELDSVSTALKLKNIYLTILSKR